MTDDLISRQAAIDAILQRLDALKGLRFGTSTFRDGIADGYAQIMSALQYLPSAEPERYMVTMSESTDIDRLKGIITKPSDITIIPLPKAEPQWIPCSERLPERGVSVLVSHVGYVSEDYLDIDDGAMYFWNSGIDLDEELNNLAWMPLPEPWKKEKTNDND